MENYYDLLGLSQSATEAEIRKAYHDLARRFHPDVNPDKSSEEKFKMMTEGYNVLTNLNQRKKYDRELDRFSKKNINKKFNAYRKQQDAAANSRPNPKPSATDRYYNAQKEDYENIKSYQEQRRATRANTTQGKPGEKIFESLREGFNRLSEGARSIFFDTASSGGSRRMESSPETEAYQPRSASQNASVNKISIIEVSVTMADVLAGVKKTVEIEEPEGMRKIRVSIPAGVKSGSVIRMRSSNKPEEELVLVVRVARHPFMQIDSRGLIVEIPITPHEAVSGASIKVPTLDEEQILLKIPPGSQSGDELRVRAKGIPDKAGPGDIYYRLLIQLPVNPHATGIADSAETLSRYYALPIRMDLPKSLKELATKPS